MPKWELYLDLIRVFHILSGITWIGILYYFNYVQGKAFNKMEPAARANATLHLVPQALLFFRWSALATLLFGIAYMAGATVAVPGYLDGDAFKNILVGGSLGLIMAANVWLIIWPNQKKIIAATRATVEEGAAAPPDQPKWTRQAFLASRANTMMSIPMLFFMVAARNLPSLWT